MWRRIHSWVGLTVAVLVITLALSGTILATRPLYQAYLHSSAGADSSVAEVIERIAKANPRIEAQRLKISHSGEATLSYARNNRLRESTVALDSGKFLRGRKEPKQYEFFQNLHRSFLLGEKGRFLPATGGIAMVLLCLSGLFLLLRRVGGIKRFFAGISLRGIANLHAAGGRLLLLPLFMSALTALWLSAVTFGIISSGQDKPPAYPESLEQLDPVEPWTLHGLQDIAIADVREIVYPIPVDWFDVWTVQTDREYIFIDQFTGDVLSRQSLPILAQIMDWVMAVHTGRGSLIWAMVLFISSLSIPFFAISGVVVWWRNKRRGKGRIRHNAKAAQATTLIVVGSEGGSTWGFAKALHHALDQAGETVRTIEMNAVARFYPKLKRIIALSATYGSGDAPGSATHFLAKLAKNRNHDLAYATLAFGDKAFVDFCAFGEAVDNALATHCAAPLLALTRIDKQSAQTFTHWCEDLSTALNLPLTVNYAPKRPKTHTLELVSRKVYGEALGTTIAVLRFSAGKLPAFNPGDLVAIYPPECAVPRLYSIGSSAKHDRYLEICVRLQEGGLCSPWLCQLQPEQTIAVTIMRNERFQMPRKGAVIMIGAGTGLSPFTGMIRHNHRKQALDLYWGGRHPQVDHLYGEEIAAWQESGRLHHYCPAWSRGETRQYVQDVIRADHDHLRTRLQSGATIMICGGQAMAAGVREEIAKIAVEIGTTISELKRHKRYLEDVY